MREVELLLDQPAVGENLSDHAGHATRSGRRPSRRACCWRWSRRRWRSSRPRRPGPSPPTWPSPAASPGSAPAPPAPDIQFHVAPVHIVEEGMGDPQAHGVWVSPCLLTAEQPRLGAARLQRPDREADRPQRLLRGRGGHAADDRRRCAWRRRSAPSRRCSPTAREPFTVPAGDSDDALRAHVAAHHVPDLPPGRHLRDRLRSSTPSCGSRASRRCASSTPR